MADVTVSPAGGAAPTLVTASMDELEQELAQQGEVEYDKERQARRAEITQYDDTMKTQRLKALHALVDKTVFYSSFLQKRIADRQEEDRQRQARAEKRAETKAATKAAQDALPQPQRETRHRAQDSASKPTTTAATRKKTSAKKSVKRTASEDEVESASEKNDAELEETSHKRPKVDEPTSTEADEAGEDSYSRVVNGERVSDRQPELLDGGVLREYQLAGMEWMVSLWENGLNGILGDEMGLGKTIQCISFIAHLIGKGVAGPYLVVAPLSTIQNWVNEFTRFAPRIKVVLYHGSQAEREQLRRKNKLSSTSKVSDCVVVTSYEMCMNDRKYLQNLRWKYIIVDEGHRLKNLNCRLIQELKSYTSVNRLLLTGTPLQNNLAELWSLLNFLLPEIFDDLKSFQAWFDFEDLGDKFLANEQKDQILQKLHVILEPFLLRRLKTDVNYYIPPKKELVVYCSLTARQREQYKATVERNFSALMENTFTSDDTLTASSSPSAETSTSSAAPARRKRSAIDYKQVSDREYFKRMQSGPVESESEFEVDPTWNTQPKRLTNIKMTNIVMQLRKITNHPYLIDYPLTDDGQYRIDEDIVTSCGKFALLDRLLPKLKEGGHRVLIFSQMTSMLDLLHDYCYLRGYEFCRLDGATSHEDRQSAIKDFNEDVDKKFIFLLSTRAGGLGINLTSADTVIIYDSDWNPQVDLQAMDRCHRIGQTKPVLVYRLVTKNSVEEKMLQRAQAKRRLEKLVVHKGKFKGQQAGGVVLDLDDIKALLIEKDGLEVNTETDTMAISDEELASLLDRSEKAFADTEYAQMAHATAQQTHKLSLAPPTVDDQESEPAPASA